MKVLAIDPSGSFKHGSGTTGWCIVEKENKKIIELGNIKAKDYKTREDYFNAHKRLFDYEFDILVIENFILYQSTASSLFNQELETSELIGLICGVAQEHHKKIVRQKAAVVKPILKKNSILLSLINQKTKQIELRTSAKDRVQWYLIKEKPIRLSNHIMDSIRHAFYYLNTEEKNVPN